MREPNTYFTHDNGGRPFKVVINGNNVSVYLNESYNGIPNSLIQSFYTQQIFIGDSPLNHTTSFSGGYGPEFLGNSFLLKLRDNEYVYIGEKIFTFQSLSKIIQYVSPIGNNDVPYPYAKDEEGNYYLVIENVILLNSSSLNTLLDQFNNELYDYYYKAQRITHDRSYLNEEDGRPILQNFDQIDKWFVGTNRYTMVYTSFPDKDFDRLTSEGETMYVELTDGSRKELSKQDYIDLNKIFGERMGFQPLIPTGNIHEIV